MKAPAWIIGCCVSLMTAAPAAFAQMPPVLPTDVTGVGPGSPGNAMLQMQVDNLLTAPPQQSLYVTGIRTQSAVIPNGSLNSSLYVTPNGYLTQPRYYIMQDRLTGQRYMLRAY